MAEAAIAPAIMTYKQCRIDNWVPLIFDIVIIALAIFVMIHILQGLAWWRKSTTPSGMIKFLLFISLIVVSTELYALILHFVKVLAVAVMRFGQRNLRAIFFFLTISLHLVLCTLHILMENLTH